MHTQLKSEEEKPFITYTAREMLFDGWSLEPYARILTKINSLIQQSSLINYTIPLDLIDAVKNAKFGFFSTVFVFQ